MGEKGAVVGKQQLRDEFLDGFRACEETPEVEETAVCSKTDVDAAWQVLFCLTEHDTDEYGEQCGSQNASLLDAVGDGEVVRQKPIVFHLTLLIFMRLAEDDEICWGQPRRARIFHNVSPLRASNALIRSTKTAYRPVFRSLHFPCIWLSTEIMPIIPMLDLNPHLLSGLFPCDIARMSLQ